MKKNVQNPPAGGKEAAMMVRSIDGWDLRSRDGAAWWIRDLELAERAGLAKPRNIRSVIAKAIRAGLLVEAVKERALAEGALYLTEEIVVKGATGSTTATEYLLNREASLLVVMRLRTERAVALQVAIVRVFLRVVDGEATSDELRALREREATHSAEMALLKTQVADIKNALLLGSATVTPHERDRVKSWRSIAAQALVDSGRTPTLPSARRTLQNAIEGIIGGPLRDDLLSPAVFGRVIGYLERETKTSVRMIKRQKQQALPGLGNVVPFKHKPKARPTEATP